MKKNYGGLNTTLFYNLKKKIKELKKSEKKYRELYEGSSDGFVRVDMNGEIKEFNQAFKNMLGYSENALFKKTYVQLTPKKWHAIEAKIVKEQILTREHSEPYEKEYIRKDGTVFPIELRTYLIKDEKSKPIGMWAFVRDITERKKAEEELRRYREHLEEMVKEKTGELQTQNFALVKSTIELAEIKKDLEDKNIELNKTIDKLKNMTKR
ncbi:MAG: PAS domain S-box protein [Nanoarchaeota archaeon]|nr:PAS domain S-box protein [Nanoarchaeota archaeon]